jgi:hypothetical protein
VAASGDSATGFFATGQIEEPRIADEIARDAEVFTAADLCWALTWRYVDLSDGTILDCNTGKQWLKDAGCLGNRFLEEVVGPEPEDARPSQVPQILAATAAQ